MKSAKKILSVFLAVLMLFSVMSVGMVAFAQTVTVSSQTGADTYNTTDDVIICVPETIYMRPGETQSVAGQYYVNNYVNESGAVVVDAYRDASSGKISIYAPGATAFSFTASTLPGSGIGDPIIGSTVNAATATYENQRWENTDLSYGTGFVYYDGLQLYINGAGLSHGESAVVEWKVTLYYGADDTTGTTYYAYTTLYMPMRSVGAVAESRMEADMNNEISSWISGVTGYSSSRTSVSSDRVGDGASTADGYLTYDPLWTSVFGVGSSEDPTDYVTPSNTIRTAHAVATNGDQWTRSVGYLGYLVIDSSRYTNTNQIPNFQIGGDVLRIDHSKPNYSLESHDIWYTMGPIVQVDQSKQEPIPEGWDAHPVDYSGDGKEYRWSTAPSYSVSDVNGKYIHVASQAHCRSTLGTTNFANAYVSVQFSLSDKSDLRAAVIQATGLDQTKYTKNSWSGATANVIEEFQEALRDAAQVLGNPAASQGSIDAALGNLTAKKNALMVTIKFDAGTNGGVFADGKTVKEYNVRFGANKEVTIGSALLNYFNAVMANGYVLAGWTTDPNADPTTASLENVTVTFGDTLYAHYKKDISVDFNYLNDVNGNTNVTTSTLTLYNGNDQALNADVPEMTNVGIYDFAGWTKDPTSTEGVMLGDTVDGVTANTAYYATYIKKLTLNLDLNGGTFDVTSVDGGVRYNYDLSETTGVATVVLPETEPTMTGYGFEGWEINGKLYQPGDEVAFSGNTTKATATAVWGVEKYNVTFNYKDLNGNNVSIKEKIAYGDAAVAPDVPDFYANSTMHYPFTGWDVAFDNITGDTVVNAQYGGGQMHSMTTEGTPNCDETVDVIYSCSCGYSYTMTVEAGHKYEVKDSKAATCEEDGYIVYVCARDSSHTYTEILPAKGHTFENTNYVAPTCTKDGYYISGTCGTCGEDLAGKTIPALGHDYVVTSSKKATCTEDGYEKYECSRCHDTYTKTLEKTGHDYIIISTAPTCTEDGVNKVYCSIHGYLYDVRVPAKGHSYVSIIFPPTCTAEGYTSLTCTICGTAIKTDPVPALGHEYVEKVVAPTCTAQGYTLHTCSVCNYSYKSDFVDALGHDYSKETVVDPTCTQRGYTLHECSRCDSSYKTDYTDALGHDYKYEKTVDATNTQDAYELYICSRCEGEYKKIIYAGGEALVCVTLTGSDGALLSDATLILTNRDTGETITIKTDKNGYFTYILPAGDYAVSLSRSGYIASSEGNVIILEGEATIMNLPILQKNTCSCLCHADSLWGNIYRLLIKMFSIFGRIYCCDDSAIWQ